MQYRLTRLETGLAIGALVVALAGGTFLGTADLNAQGFGGGFGQGRAGGPGGGRGGPGGPGGPGRGGPMGEPGPLGDLMLGRLDLTDTQRDQVKQVVDSHRDEQRAIGERGRAAHEALDAAIAADPFDEGLVRAKASDLAIVEADMAVARGRIRSEVLQLLTSAQRDKLKTIQADMAKRRGEMERQREERRQNRR